MDKLLVIKIGGNIIDDAEKLQAFLRDFSQLKERAILVHGGGKVATRIGERLGIASKYVDGRRITDEPMLEVVTMVYGGLVNKQIVAQLQALGCNAMGLTGADGNVIQAHKRVHATIDYGFAGDVDLVNSTLIATPLAAGITPVLAPITHNKQGLLLNTNADTIAQEVAKAMSGAYEVHLIYSFEKSGVLLDANDDSTVIPQIRPDYYAQLKADAKIFAGMIPKIDNAYVAIKGGVGAVIIGKAEQLHQLVDGTSGTRISP
jgi:acetylglutamate kinase